MAGFRRELNILVGVAAVYAAAFFLGYYASGAWDAVRLDTVQPSYLHHQFIELRLRTRNPALRRAWKASPPRARVLKDGAPVTTIAGIRDVPLAWDPKRSAWTGRWPCPWNAPEGEYVPELLAPEPSSAVDESWKRKLKVDPFRIARRKLPRLPPGFSVMTWESVRPLKELQVRAPDGKLKDWQGLLDWVQYVGADALWVLGGQTPGLEPGQKWMERNLDMIPEVARECKRRGLKFGVYAMCYLTMSETNRVPGYEYAVAVEDDEVKTTRAISIRDPRRPKDVAAFLARFRDVPGVDFLGLDYIRNALGGHELASEFLAEMPGVHPPPDWDKLEARERMTWFARKKALRKDKAFIDAWQWWRAWRVSRIIEGIKRELGPEKLLWAFTLTWERGWHHGQDVPMFHDAGVDVDALMLYEADAGQFEWMVEDWRSYLKASEAQVLAGDVVDWPLHQKSQRGPGEMGYRLRRAITGVHADGLAAGLFVHDLERALRGRLGPFTTRQWMDETRGVIQEFKRGPAAMRAVKLEAPAKPEPKVPPETPEKARPI